jgi:hypothetical protein
LLGRQGKRKNAACEGAEGSQNIWGTKNEECSCWWCEPGLTLSLELCCSCQSPTIIPAMKSLPFPLWLQSQSIIP